MAEPICKNCGEPEGYHCLNFEPIVIPKGCVCNPRNWSGEIRPICDNLEEDSGKFVGMCKKCEHNVECHTKGQ